MTSPPPRLGDKVIVCIPTEGRPFICEQLNGDETADIQNVVGGYLQRLNNNNIGMITMFLESDTRYTMVQEIMQYRHSVIYVDENGRYDKAPNFAFAYKEGNQIVPLFGYVAVVVKWDFIVSKNYHLSGLKIKDIDSYHFGEYGHESDDEGNGDSESDTEY